MEETRDTEQWVFVSHASADIQRVREVRNYLEARGASPLLFHLLALKAPDEFWPLIDREIQASNFFLYCDSPAAATSTWVQKERAAVELAMQQSPKRVGRVAVDGGSIDKAALDAFLSKCRVFLSHTHADRERVAPFARALKSAEFGVFDAFANIDIGENWSKRIEQELNAAAENGWVLIFLSSSSKHSRFVDHETRLAMRTTEKIVPVLLDDVELPQPLRHLKCLDAFSIPEKAPSVLIDMLLRG